MTARSAKDGEGKLRFRFKFMFLGFFLYVAVSLLTDPDSGIIQNLPMGAGTLATIVILLKSLLYVAMLHLSRRALADYIDFEVVYNKCMETSEGAGKLAIAIGLMMVSVAIVIFAATS